MAAVDVSNLQYNAADGISPPSNSCLAGRTKRTMLACKVPALQLITNIEEDEEKAADKLACACRVPA